MSKHIILAALSFLFDATTQRAAWTCSRKFEHLKRLLNIFSLLLPSPKHSCLFYLKIAVINFFYAVTYS
jgi:hypothetical protein